MKFLRFVILPLVLILSIENSFAGCFGLTSLLSGKKKTYAEVHQALSDLQSALENIRRLGSRKWKPMERHSLVDMVAPGNRVSLSDVKEMKEDFSLLQGSLTTISNSIDVLSSAMEEPAENLIKSRSLPILQLIITRTVYSNSFVHSMRLIERFRDAPEWVNGHNAEISTTLRVVSPKTLDSNLKTLFKRLLTMAPETPEVISALAEDFRSSNSPARLETSATLVRPPATLPLDMSLEEYVRWGERWNAFLKGWQANREKANSVKVQALVLPSLGMGLTSEATGSKTLATATSPAKTNGQKPLIDDELANDLGVTPRDQTGEGDGSKPSRNGLVAKSERSRQMAIDLMPAKQRAAYEARKAQDQKLKAARQGGGAAAKPAE